MDKLPSVEMMASPLMTFTITAGELRRMLEMPSELVDHCLLKARIDGKRLWLESAMVDVCHITMLEQQMEQPLFSGSLRFEKEQEFFLPVKEIYTHFKVKALFPKAKELEFAFDKNDINVRFEIDGNVIVSKFHQEAGAATRPKVPRLVFPVEVPDIGMKEFLRIFKALFGSSNFVRLWCVQKSPRRGTVFMSDVGLESISMPNSVMLKYPARLTKVKEGGNSVWPKPEIDGLTVSTYPNDYLGPVIKGIAKVTDKITVRFATNYPMAIEWSHEGLSGYYILAPRIESK